ncbi:MAG TPA: hypothetical protein VI911_11910 [Patescibacteria group bacterium]|nr:hypothetical protein [Patescibacteria group bacterium]
MYKLLLKTIEKQKEDKLNFINNLHKSIGEKPNAILNRQPHFIFSTENPRYPTKTKMTHEDVLDLLRDKGYDAHEMYGVDEIEGKYGDKEKSILIHNPHIRSIPHLHQLVQALGQESSLYSSGLNSELHFHSGPNAGQHMKGTGTDIPKVKPNDNYSETKDGMVFQHNMDHENLYPMSESMLKMKPTKINKSEFYAKNGFYLCKNQDKHPLEDHNPDTKLIHYSPQQGLTELDPEHHGVRGIGSEAKQGKPEHPMSFFYLENTEPEHIVTSGSKSKYITSLGSKKLYDIGKDSHNLWSQAEEIAQKRQTNPGVVRKEDFHNAIRNAGYHGIYNSSLGDTMKNVVGMFEKMPIEKEVPMHPMDFKRTTSFDHNSNKQIHSSAEQYANEFGHHDPKFLAKLKMSLR